MDKKTIFWISGIFFVTVGAFVIPSLVKKYGNRIYKNELKKDEIDYDSLGPEIVKKEQRKTEE